jgi:hypothetical protein
LGIGGGNPDEVCGRNRADQMTAELIGQQQGLVKFTRA